MTPLRTLNWSHFRLVEAINFVTLRFQSSEGLSLRQGFVLQMILVQNNNKSMKTRNQFPIKPGNLNYILPTNETKEVALATIIGGRSGYILRQVAWQLRLVESLLNLVVDELDEGVVLFRELLLKYSIVLLSNLVRSFLKEMSKN